MNKYISILPLCIVSVLIPISLNAQPVEWVKEYYTLRGTKTADSASSYFYSVGKKLRVSGVRETDLEDWMKIEPFVDTVNSYFTRTGKLKSQQVFVKGKVEGQMTAYFENGKISAQGSYANGIPAGTHTYWYPNGNQHRVFEYVSAISEYALLQYWDSTGVQLIRDGEGFCKCYGLNGYEFREEGKMVGGLHWSDWSAYRGDTLVLKETYDHGKFVSGIRYGRGGQTRYTQMEVQPEFPGGIPKLIEFLMKNMVYPRTARKRGIEGRSYIGFIVDRDGSVSDIAVVKSADPLLDFEAMRVVSKMPRWQPGFQRGQAVRARYALPINFKLK